MQKICHFFILVFSLSFICYSQAYYEGSDYISDGVRQPLIIHASKEESQILKSRWQAIGEELKTTDSMLAGTYIKSGYRGYYLRWSPKNGFVYIFHYEDIDIIDYSFGKVEVNGLEITFVPEREMQNEFRGKKLITPKSWIVIGRNLIPKESVKDFADYRSGLGAYNNWNCECMAFFSKRFPEKAPKFVIPKQYKHLFRSPIEGKIIFVGKSKVVRKPDFVPQVVIPLKMNVGKDKGVRKGMLLRVSIHEDVMREIEITRVYKNFSLGTITDGISEDEKDLIPTYYDLTTGKDKPFPPLRVGTKVSTELSPY